MVAEAQTCAIGIITILNILVALYLSRVLYKSTLFMQNKPNLLKRQMNVSSVNTMNYELRTMNYFMQNKPNLSLPKGDQTQYKAKTNPIYPYRRGIKPNFTPLEAYNEHLTGGRSEKVENVLKGHVKIADYSSDYFGTLFLA